MSNRAQMLAARRNELLAHCDVQRSHLATTTQQIEARLAGIDRGVAAIQRYVRSPLLWVAGATCIALFGPKRLLRWASRGAFLFATAQRLMHLTRRP